MTRHFTAGLVALTAASGAAFGVTGAWQPGYGAPLALQAAPTGFGNSNLGLIDFANGSELNGLFCFVSGGNLNLLFTGNLESNFNKFELFIDHRDGGQNQLRGDNPDVDFNGLNRMAGLTFDTGFEPDTWISITGGDVGGGTYRRFASAAELLTAGGGFGSYIGEGLAGVGGLSGGNNFLGVDLTINNSNTGGLPGDPALSLTGIEISIPLASLGILSADGVKVAAFINGSGHDFVSNQVLGSLPADFGNLGEPSQVNFNNYAGLQYVTLPTPGAAALLSLAGLAAARRRRA